MSHLVFIRMRRMVCIQHDIVSSENWIIHHCPYDQLIDLTPLFQNFEPSMGRQHDFQRPEKIHHLKSASASQLTMSLSFHGN